MYKSIYDIGALQQRIQFRKIKIIEENSEDERKIIVTYNNSGDGIEFIYFSDRTIKVYNNYQFNNSLIGQDYSLANLLYNPSNPNVMIQQGANNLYCTYEFLSYFSEDGIEDRREFKLFPKADKEEKNIRNLVLFKGKKILFLQR